MQIACPRLSIDWGHHFDRPLLNPYECFCAFGEEAPFYESKPLETDGSYPMDFYAKKAENSPWSVYHAPLKLEYTD